MINLIVIILVSLGVGVFIGGTIDKATTSVGKSLRDEFKDPLEKPKPKHKKPSFDNNKTSRLSQE